MFVGTVPEGLEVIGKEQPKPLGGFAGASGEPVLYIAGEPDVAVFGERHGVKVTGMRKRYLQKGLALALVQKNAARVRNGLILKSEPIYVG
jgi:hypothetical protein